jgi:hypothetical protein
VKALHLPTPNGSAYFSFSAPRSRSNPSHEVKMPKAQPTTTTAESVFTLYLLQTVIRPAD